MHHNIRGPSRQSNLSRPISHRTNRSLRFVTAGNSRQSSRLKSRQNSRQVSRQLLPGEATVNNIIFKDLFEIFAGNDRIKCLSRTRSDRKLLKFPTIRMTALRVLYSSSHKTFTLQAIYCDDTNLSVPINGIIHAALDIYDPLPPTTFTAIIDDLKTITIFSDSNIRAIRFSYKNGDYRVIGDSKRKVSYNVNVD